MHLHTDIDQFYIHKTYAFIHIYKHIYRCIQKVLRLLPVKPFGLLPSASTGTTDSVPCMKNHQDLGKGPDLFVIEINNRTSISSPKSSLVAYVFEHTFLKQSHNAIGLKLLFNMLQSLWIISKE